MPATNAPTAPLFSANWTKAKTTARFKSIAAELGDLLGRPVLTGSGYYVFEIDEVTTISVAATITKGRNNGTVSVQARKYDRTVGSAINPTADEAVALAVEVA